MGEFALIRRLSCRQAGDVLDSVPGFAHIERWPQGCDMSNFSSPPAARRVLVLAGGTSSEREISLQSGAAVHAALTARGHEAALVDPAITDLFQCAWSPRDLAFIALHGAFGEDGEVQQLLEAAGIPYTGSDPHASRLAFSKSAAKLRFQQQGVPTPRYALVHRSDSPARLAELAERVGYPLVFKADQQGSSLGIVFVSKTEELQAAAEECFAYGPFAILEQMIVGTEWTLAVIDEATLPLIQIETPHSFFDYQAKYTDEQTQYLFESSYPPEVLEQVRSTGAAACRAIGTSGIARVDLRLDADLHPWVLEVNTIPGMTDHSLVPKAADRAGISFGELCERAIESALRRHARSAETRTELPVAQPEWRQAG